MSRIPSLTEMVGGSTLPESDGKPGILVEDVSVFDSFGKWEALKGLEAGVSNSGSAVHPPVCSHSLQPQRKLLGVGGGCP